MFEVNVKNVMEEKEKKEHRSVLGFWLFEMFGNF